MIEVINMNKRIKKKHDLNRKHCLINKAESIRFNLDYCFISTLLSNGYYMLYPIYSDIYWIEYDKWFKSINGKRCLSYILKKHHIPKVI